jgi:signal transduction histidine kinase
MSDALHRPSIRRSVFARLVAIMLVMAVSLLGLVGVFFSLIVSPALNVAIDRLVVEYGRVVAASGPDLGAARQMAARTGVAIRYEGPAGAWATSVHMPTIAAVRGRPAERDTWDFTAHGTCLAPAPDGGTYLFAWNFSRGTYALHHMLLAFLLLMMVGVVLVTHIVLRRLLSPLRTLGDGVARLSAGDLDVVLPTPAADEFGVLTEAFNRMVARVRGMLEARDQLLRDVSHELRSPLTRMKVALELLPPSENRARMAADVAEMEAMTTELLELERLRDGRSMRMERRDLVPLLSEAARAFACRPPGVRFDAPAAAIPVDLDGDSFRGVLRNLLENAVAYSLPDSRPVRLSATSTGGGVVIGVTDDGPGIPEEDLPRLFEPFFRVDRSRSKKTGGYGLGLSICKRIVEAHGGELTVRNLSPRGAAFTVTLPARPGA